MNISANTKISELIKANPDCIEAIVSINKHFEKLRNPILRKILASRVTIADASKIGGCKVEDFFKKLLPLGFVVANGTIQTSSESANLQHPAFMKNTTPENTTTLDVRAELASGRDPFQKIMQTLAAMPPENTLLIINTFEPVPLINILNKKGFEHYTEEGENKTTYTYLKNSGAANITKPDILSSQHSKGDFKTVAGKYTNKTIFVDVRNLEMPLPMITILRELESLPQDYALFVNHKKIPQFLFPELVEKNFDWLIDEVSEGDVKLLIFK